MAIGELERGRIDAGRKLLAGTLAYLDGDDGPGEDREP
jgi:hypothetical protein